jgi:hypothetical protein
MVPRGRLQLRDGHLTRLDPAAIAAALSWCASPTTSADDIERILSDLSDDDLKHLMLYESGPAARLAWMEYGRRRRFVDFQVQLAVGTDEVRITYTGEAKALHSPAFYTDKD